MTPPRKARVAASAKPPPFAVDPGNRSLRDRKTLLRAELLHRRRVIPADLQDTTRWKVANHLRTLLSENGPTVVALYWPRGNEVDLRPLARELIEEGHTVVLPRVVQKGFPLSFAIWDGESTEDDALSIPTGTGPELWPAVIVAPMVGYNRKGYRLGYGGGFYDATFKAAPWPTVTIGVCQTELEISDFPAEYHDVRLGYIVTGKEVVVCQ
jgi:5,10-methenyltetrahydrofolate synthetase